MTYNRSRLLAFLAVGVLMLTSFGPASQSQAQGNTRTFPETGKTVSGRFLEYWNTHGGLAQQGFPISEAMPQVSDTDGKTYIMQYFERAVFELHPEFLPPNDVLLSLLGVFAYNRKYSSGEPIAVSTGGRYFPETQKHVAEPFLTYWNTHGGLAQQGYPISEEFIEVSELNGLSYRVQYFQRAEFEYHPENPAPFNILLSQLGTIQYRIKSAPPTPVPAPPTATPLPPTAVPPPAQPTNTPVPAAGPCDGIPPSQNVFILPSNCERRGAEFIFDARGFQPGENVGVYITGPDQAVYGAPFQVTAGGDGYILETVYLETSPVFPLGLWAITFEGVSSHSRAIGYFKLYN